MALAFRPSTKHQCHLCPKSYSRAYHLQSHLDAHQGVKRFRCIKCQTLFVRKNDLRAHSIEKHSASNEKPTFRCHQVGPDGALVGCGKVFTRKSLLSRHLRGAKTTACRGAAALPAIPAGGELLDKGFILVGRGRAATNAGGFADVDDVLADYQPKAGGPVNGVQEQRYHAVVRDHTSPHHYQSSSRRYLCLNDPTSIQSFSRDYFMEWLPVGEIIAIEAFQMIEDSMASALVRPGRVKANFTRWCHMYANAMTLTRRLLSTDEVSCHSQMSWLSVLAALSSGLVEDEDSRAHLSEMRRRSELMCIGRRKWSSIVANSSTPFRVRLGNDPHCICRQVTPTTEHKRNPTFRQRWTPGVPEFRIRLNGPETCSSSDSIHPNITPDKWEQHDAVWAFACPYASTNRKRDSYTTIMSCGPGLLDRAAYSDSDNEISDTSASRSPSNLHKYSNLPLDMGTLISSTSIADHNWYC